MTVTCYGRSTCRASCPNWGPNSHETVDAADLTARGQPQPDGHMSDADFAAFAKLIHAKTGIVINDAKRSMLVSRLSRRLRDLGLAISASYRDLLDVRGRRCGTRCIHFRDHDQRHQFLP
jgi:hypothetical protein